MSGILTNTTFITAPANAGAVRSWLAEVYVPRAEACGVYSDILAMRVLTQVADDTVSYAVQMRCAGVAEARVWDNSHAPELFDDLARRFGREGVVHFTTHMHIL